MKHVVTSAVRCTASRLCKRPGLEVEGLPRPVCLKHAVKKAGGRYGVSRQKGGRSKAEADYAVWLGLAEKAGQVRNIKREVKYELRLDGCFAWRSSADPAFQLKSDGVLIETYYLDFLFEQKEGRKWIVRRVDKKAGLYTGDFKRKKKWVEAIYGIVIETPDETRRK